IRPADPLGHRSGRGGDRRLPPAEPGLRATLPGGAAAGQRGARAGLGGGRAGCRIRRRDRRWRRIDPMVKTALGATTERVPGPRSDIVVGLAQMAPRLGDLGANVSRHLELIGAAPAGGADLVVFPELSLTGYFLKDLVTETALRLDSPEIQALAEASREVDAVVGCILESDDHRFHNAALYLSGGAVVHVHRKVYLPTYGLFDEARDLAAGNRFRAFEAPLRSAGPPRGRPARLARPRAPAPPPRPPAARRGGGGGGTGARPRHRAELRRDHAHL